MDEAPTNQAREQTGEQAGAETRQARRLDVDRAGVGAALAGGFALAAGPAAGIVLGAIANRIAPVIVGVGLGLLLPVAGRVLSSALRASHRGGATAFDLLRGGGCVLAVVAAATPSSDSLGRGAAVLLGVDAGVALAATAGVGVLLLIAGWVAWRRSKEPSAGVPAGGGEGMSP